MKERLDVLLVQRGYFNSREKAKAAIMAGLVYVNSQISDKAGTAIDVDASIEVRDNPCPYVSRGGMKLQKAIDEFNISLEEAIAIDIGASTGGFTDCILSYGASKVYAIDVGYGQLDYTLRTDPRVVNMEKTNIRYLDTELIHEKADLISIDVSFISLKLVFPVASKLLKDKGKVVALIKPQFEAGKEQVGKRGIVREKSIHKEVINKVMDYGIKVGLFPTGLTYSPMTGAKGNIEYLLLLEKDTKVNVDIDVDRVTDLAHNDLLNI
ncbi:MAG: TlyA family RNA methyltransferase [Clostridiales bacterium]|nr:TlyA family RNA methyltransferase [Clostridiales bacterium]